MARQAEIALAARLVEKDAVLTFNSEIFNISSSLFCSFSRKFRRDYQTRQSPLIIETSAHRNTVVEFINACQLRKCTITVDNAHDLLVLAREWGVSQLEIALIKFMGLPENCVPLLIPSLRHALSCNSDTAGLEHQLRGHFLSLIETDSLLELPLPLLLRALLPLPAFDSAVFNFLVRCLDHYGPRASIFFRDFSIDLLTPVQIAALRSHQHFRWCFIGPSAGTALINLITESARQRESLADLTERESGVIVGLVARVGELELRVERLLRELEAKTVANENQMAQDRAVVQEHAREIQSVNERTKRIEEALPQQLQEIRLAGDRTAQHEEKLQDQLQKIQLVGDRAGRIEAALEQQLQKTQATSDRTVQLDQKLQQQLQKTQATSDHTVQLDQKLQEQTREIRLAGDRTGRNEAALLELRNSMADHQKKVLKISLPPFPILHESLFCPARPMDGLIRHLTTVHGGPAAMLARGVIEVHGSSLWDSTSEYAASKLVDQNENSYFVSDAAPGQWICIDFKTMRVLPNHYTLLSRKDKGPNDRNLKSWILEASETGDQGPWVKIATERDRAELNGKGFRYTFPIKRQFAGRCIRIRSIAPPFGYEGLVLAGMELFGALMKPE
jgi:hypothetical protein